MTSLALFFALAAVADWVTVLWHSEREKGHVFRTAGLSMVLESLSWLPVWFALQLEDYRIAIVSILGSAAGTAFGLFRINRKDGNPVEEIPLPPVSPSCPPTLQYGFGEQGPMTVLGFVPRRIGGIEEE